MNRRATPPGRAAALARGAGAVSAALLVACAALLPRPAFAQSGKGDYLGVWSVAASAGYAVPNTDQYGNSLTWRLSGGYSPMPRFELDLEVGRFSVDVDQPEANGIPEHTIASGTLAVRPVCLTAQYRHPLPDLFSTLILLAGGGYYFIDYDMAAAPRAVFAAGGVRGLPDQSVDDAWGFHAGAGIEYAYSERLSLVAEGRYLVLAPHADGTAAPGRRIDGSLDLDTWILTGGLKVTF